MFHRWRCYFLILSILFIFSLSTLYISHTTQKEDSPHIKDLSSPSSSCLPTASQGSLKPLSCRINHKVRENLGLPRVNSKESDETTCYASQEDGSNIFIPFSLLKKSQDDIKGELIRNQKHGGDSYFAIEYSYSRIFREPAYQGPSGPFLFFGNFDVESRSRVLCISAEESVPVSFQWDKNGYLYPTQIAQYGLSHWSKSLRMSGPPNRTVYESGLPGATANWDGDTLRVDNLKCIHFDSDISLKLSSTKKILFFDLWPSENVTISLSILMNKTQRVHLVYTPGKVPPYIQRKGHTVIFTYSEERSKMRFTRNIHNDLLKGGVITQSKLKRALPFIERIKFSGVGCLSNLTLSNEEHYQMFLSAADWFLRNQDRNGGWPVNVLFNEKKLKYLKAEEIQPGWYSGMAQGHALSVLSRAYVSSGDPKYLEAASKALPLFSLPSSKGGFKAVFLDSYVWYEEYPTNPPSFVLNGFMYSLLGLYDISTLLAGEDDITSSEARGLYEDGLSSLLDMMYLFDVGYRSVYDLRHFSMKSPPKLARWDYHSTHINLLYALSSVQNGSSQGQMIKIAERWTNYMLGDYSEHN